MANAFVEGITYQVHSPGCCGVSFAMQADRLDALKKSCGGYWCPNCGDHRVFNNTAETRDKRELREAKERAERAEREAAAATSAAHSVNRQLQKMRLRVRQGICPCCDTKFDSLAEHMVKQHPEFSDRDLLRVFRESYGMTQAQLAEKAGIVATQVSCFETGKPVGAVAKRRLANWLAAQLTH